MVERTKQDAREAYVLHGYAYRETSLLLEVFARGVGRVSMVARAARSPRSSLRGMLLAFQPLALSWFGRGELRTLAHAEWVGGQPLLRGEALMCGFYLNELLLRMLPREDPHDALFSSYQETLGRLAGTNGSAQALRSFEKALLKEVGYAMVLERDGERGVTIDAAKTYAYDPERGPVESGRTESEVLVSGQTLLDMARDDYSDSRTQQQAKALLRALINHRLEHRPLKSRQIFRDLLAL